jgi:RimJ/RimL family protein N-acetyltransferase
MDGNNDKPEVVDSERIVTSLRVLKRLDPAKESPEELHKLYQQLMADPMNADDYGLNNVQLWIHRMFEPNAEHYVGGNMFVGVLNIIPRINADVHYAALGPLEYGSIRELIGPLFEHLFDTYELNRLTAYIPAPNKEAQRVATLAGFKYEGEMRGMFLRDGVYHNLQIHGLTKADFALRRR